jgi:hypothetical protein
MRLPFISREHHEAVLAAKDALIRTLEVQNAALLNRLAQDIHIDMKMPEGERPADASPEAANVQRGPRRKALQIDWSRVNEDDPEELARIAAAEIGTQVPPYALSRYISSLKTNIKRAKLHKQLEAAKTGSVATLVTVVDPEPIDEESIPQDIKDRIAEAERG